MIPKIIHYCWFGPNPKSEIALQCIASWKQHAPNFELKEWNERNTTPYQNKFYKNAYRKKQYAFVADALRVAVLREFGGVYMDLDMLLVKPITPLLSYDFFSGYEIKGRTAYGLFGGLPNHRFFNAMNTFYAETPFNEFSLPVITHTFASVIHRDQLHTKEHIFDPEYFYALQYQDRDKDYALFVTAESYAVHLWDHSWAPKEKIESIGLLLRNLRVVCVDYFFHGYPSSYFKRYGTEFTRKIIQKVTSNK
jgi:mannosyltransferase OCH1-like enzyme